MADLTRVAEVLAVHGERHVSIVGAEIWCATCDRPIGSAEGDDAETDLVIAAHQADALRAKGLVVSEAKRWWRVVRSVGEVRGGAPWPERAMAERQMRDGDRLEFSDVTPWRTADEGSED